MSVSVMPQSETLLSDWPFDVFLCYNREDKGQVTEIAKQLKTKGMHVWLDEWELQPGQIWKQELDARLLEVATVAVFVGPNGKAPWMDLDVQAFLMEFSRLNCPIIPVILEEVRKRPELPAYMQGTSWVDFRKYRPDPIDQLCQKIADKQTFAIARPTLAFPDDAEFIPDIDDLEIADGEEFDVEAAEGPVAPPQPSITDLHQGMVVQLADGVSLEMRNIPAGTYEMGAPADEAASDDDERPQHEVDVTAFSIGTYPITQAQWRVVAGWPEIEEELSPSPSGFAGDSRPVEMITFLQAQEFCDRLSQHTGRAFRLPSEAEWEYACRSGTKTPFHFGEELTPETSNFLETHHETTEVGKYPANGYGLYDMHGNVWEWCTDVWHNSYDGAPTTSVPWLEDGFDEARVLRGGSWDSEANCCRSAYRIGCKYDGCDYFIGFRVVCESKED